jgi:hypothetical protein
MLCEPSIKTLSWRPKASFLFDEVLSNAELAGRQEEVVLRTLCPSLAPGPSPLHAEAAKEMTKRNARRLFNSIQCMKCPPLHEYAGTESVVLSTVKNILMR